MMKFLLLPFILICIHSYTQVWEYPPEVYSNWQPNGNIPKDSLRQITSWSHEIVDGYETGKKTLKLVQTFDSIGNTTLLYYGKDSTYFYNYVNGFWGYKVQGKDTIRQAIKFDNSKNVIDVRMDGMHIEIHYDSLQRAITKTMELRKPIKGVNRFERHFWNYKSGHLSEFSIYKNDIISEKRKYYYDTLMNTISYSTYFYNKSGVLYTEHDSVVGFLQNENSPTKLLAYTFENGYLADSMEIITNTDKSELVTTSHIGKTTIKREKGNHNYVKSVSFFGTENKLFRKESYDYEFKTTN